MRLLTVKAGLFIVYFLVVFHIIEYALVRISKDEHRYLLQYQELFDPAINADIVIFGPSDAVRGINPKLLEESNISAFNFALNGATPEFIYDWYTMYFKEYYKKPKLVLLVVGWQFFNEKWLWRKIEQDSKYLPFKEFLSGIINLSHKKTLLLNRYQIFSGKNEMNSGERPDLTYNGFTPLIGINDSTSFSSKVNFDPTKQINYFNLLLKTLKEDNIHVILVFLPEKTSKEHRNTNLVKNIDNHIFEAADQFGFDVINYQQDFQVDSLFYNWNHLNNNGTDIVTKRLKKDIKALEIKGIYQ